MVSRPAGPVSMKSRYRIRTGSCESLVTETYNGVTMLGRSDGEPDQRCESRETTTPDAEATAEPSDARWAPAAGTSWGWCAQAAASTSGMNRLMEWNV